VITNLLQSKQTKTAILKCREGLGKLLKWMFILKYIMIVMMELK